MELARRHEWSQGTTDKQGPRISGREGLFLEPRKTCRREGCCPSIRTAQNLPGLLGLVSSPDLPFSQVPRQPPRFPSQASVASS